MKKKTNKKQTYEVDVAVTFFLTQEVEATDEDEASSIAEHSVDRKLILSTWEDGDYEVESHGATRVMEEEDEDNE